MSRKVRVYLSGAIESAPDGGTTWRNFAADKSRGTSRIDCLNPIEFNANINPDNPNWRSKKSFSNDEYMRTIRHIVKRDINAMMSCDICLVYWDKWAAGSLGTHAELTSAFLGGKRVLVVLEDGNKKDVDKLPAWLLACSHEFYTSIEQAFDGIAEYAEELPDKAKDKINIGPRK